MFSWQKNETLSASGKRTVLIIGGSGIDNKDILDAAIKGIPKDIEIVQQVADTIITSPNDIHGFSDDSSLATAQRAYKVKGTAKVYSVEFYGSASEKYTIIEKQVAGNLASARIAEKLPAGIAMDDVKFSSSVQEQDEYAPTS